MIKACILLAILLPIPAPVILGSLATRIRLLRGRPRSVWGITPILTLPLLSQCDRMLGIQSNSMVFNTYYITSDFDINLKRVSDWLRKNHRRYYQNFQRLVFALALLRFDIFHYFYDHGILPSDREESGISKEELRALHSCGKRLYTFAYGADVRTRARTLALGKFNCCMHCPQPGKYCICDEAAAKTVMSDLSRYSTAMVAMGDMVTYVPDCINMPYWPIDVNRLTPVPSSGAPLGRLRVAHAPNHAEFKGTAYLESAVQRLNSEGITVELVRIQGRPNSAVIDLFASVDVVADQFIIGFHGYTAIEAMALGKPVLCYLSETGNVIAPEECPIINTNPDTLYDTLRECALGKYDLAEIGRRGRDYVERHYSLQAIAQRLGDLYINTAQFPPQTASGLSAELARLRQYSGRGSGNGANQRTMQKSTGRLFSTGTVIATMATIGFLVLIGWGKAIVRIQLLALRAVKRFLTRLM